MEFRSTETVLLFDSVAAQGESIQLLPATCSDGVVAYSVVFLCACVRSPNETGTTALVYKSKKRTELNAKGYHIYTSIGDQWSDITGPYVGNRTFKVPNVLHTVAV